MLDPGFAMWVLVAAVAVGAFAQGATGFGFSLLAVPACAVSLEGALVIGTVARLAVAVDLGVAFADVRGVDRRLAAHYLLPAAAALPVGLFVANAVPADALVAAACVATLATVGALAFGSARAPAVAAVGVQSPREHWATGFASGLMGITTGMSGPPLAVGALRANRPIVQSRATLALVFVVIDLLAAASHPRAAGLALTGTLVAIAAVALLAGRHASTRVSDATLRRAVTGIVAIVAVAALGRLLLGSS